MGDQDYPTPDLSDAPAEAPVEGAQEPVQSENDSVPENNNEGSQPAPVANPATQAPTWDPEQWQLKYRDQTIKPKSRDDLVRLAQQGFSYNQNMRVLNEQKTKLESQYGKYAQLGSALETNPELAKLVMESVQKYVAGQNNQGQPAGQPQEGQPQYAQVDPVIYTKLQKFEQFQQQQQIAAEDQALNTEIDKLKTQYADQDWNYDGGQGTLLQRVLQHAHDNEIPLHTAYKDLMWDTLQTNAKAEALKKQQEAQVQARKAGVINGSMGGGNRPQPNAGYQRGDSYKSLTEKAIAELSN